MLPQLFTEYIGPRHNLETINSRPIKKEFFEWMFPPNLMATIVAETNRYSEQCIRRKPKTLSMIMTTHYYRRLKGVYYYDFLNRNSNPARGVETIMNVMLKQRFE